ncbi:MAG: DUF1844 domain-containing protein [Bdellovibrionota bacterium]
MTKSSSTEPSINFETFILSLGTATFVALGELENPVTKKKELDLASAKHNIDILDILESKTKGNLTEREEALMKEVLYEVRLRYVAKNKA